MATYVGVIKSYNAGNGYGFIECQQTHALYGRDIFLHRQEFSNSQTDVGGRVEFEIMLSDKNQPKAVNVRGQGGPPMGMQPLPGRSLAAQISQVPTNPSNLLPLGSSIQPPIQPPGSSLKRSNAAVQQPRLFGQIRTFNQQRGYGFLQSEAVAAMLGSPDVFLHYSQALNFRVGDFVTFELVMGGGSGASEGKPQARALIKEGGAPIGIPPQNLTQHQQQPKYNVYNNLKRQNPHNNNLSNPIVQYDPNQKFSGLIKSYNDSRGFGFIDCAEIKNGGVSMEFMGKDVFLLRKELERANAGGKEGTPDAVGVGDIVSFTVRCDKGNPQAVGIEKAGAEGISNDNNLNNQQNLNNMSNPTSNSMSNPINNSTSGLTPQEKLDILTPGPHFGIIKSFNSSKGYGFITTEAVEAVWGGGQDVFLHKNEIEGDVSCVGKECEFSIVLNKYGKPQASSVVVMGASGGSSGIKSDLEGDELGLDLDLDGGLGNDAKRRKLNAEV